MTDDWGGRKWESMDRRGQCVNTSEIEAGGVAEDKERRSGQQRSLEKKPNREKADGVWRKTGQRQDWNRRRKGQQDTTLHLSGPPSFFSGSSSSSRGGVLLAKLPRPMSIAAEGGMSTSCRHWHPLGTAIGATRTGGWVEMRRLNGLRT